MNYIWGISLKKNVFHVRGMKEAFCFSLWQRKSYGALLECHLQGDRTECLNIYEREEKRNVHERT